MQIPFPIRHNVNLALQSFECVLSRCVSTFALPCFNYAVPKMYPIVLVIPLQF